LVRVPGGSYRAISADELAEMLQAKNLTLVNVHIPYEGEIEPTDAFIPFSEIEKHLDELPPDKNATIVLYCRRGVMSADAARVLAQLGYTGIYDLKGGMNAWKATGRQVLVKPS
jgi:phage shock protein E